MTGCKAANTILGGSTRWRRQTGKLEKPQSIVWETHTQQNPNGCKTGKGGCGRIGYLIDKIDQQKKEKRKGKSKEKKGKKKAFRVCGRRRRTCALDGKQLVLEIGLDLGDTPQLVQRV